MRTFSVLTGLTLGLAVVACVGDDATSTPPNGSNPSGTPDGGTPDSSQPAPDSGSDSSSGNPPGNHALVFVTSGEFDGQLDGVTGADAFCQQAAKNAGLPGGETAGSYLAWIASTTDNAP